MKSFKTNGLAADFHDGATPHVIIYGPGIGDEAVGIVIPARAFRELANFLMSAQVAIVRKQRPAAADK